MKLKHVVASFALSFAMGFGALAGLMASKEAKAAKATGEWMVTICFDNSVPEESDAWGYIDSQKVNFWGQNVTYAGSEESFHQTGRDHFYAVNVVFASNQTVTGMQINFKEDGNKKESQDINLSLDSGCNGRVYTFAFPSEVTWTDGKWSYYQDSGYDEPNGDFNNVQKSFTADPATKSYYVKDVELKTGQYVSLCPFCYSAHNWNDTSAVVRDDAEYRSEYIMSIWADNWFEIKIDGTYDFFITNEYKDGGVLDMKRHEDPSDTYIYYVTNSASATTDYIYSFGGEEQFGAFPGTAIADLVTADDAEEVTGNGVIHFQGSNEVKLIYRINITKGYPTGDTTFMFNNGTSEYKSDEREIVNESAYWWTGAANHDAAQGLEFILLLEGYRDSAEDNSVCNFSELNAAFVVGKYNELSDSILSTYVDNSTIYTWADASKESEALWSVKDMIAVLGKIGGVTPKGSSAYFGQYSFISNNAATIIIAIATISTIAATMFFVFKKKKQG